VKNLKCERSQCHWRNARFYRAVLSLDLKVAMLTVISEFTVSESLFQTAGAAWQKAFLEKLRVDGLHWRMFALRGLSCIGFAEVLSYSSNMHALYHPLNYDRVLRTDAEKRQLLNTPADSESAAWWWPASRPAGQPLTAAEWRRSFYISWRSPHRPVTSLEQPIAACHLLFIHNGRKKTN